MITHIGIKDFAVIKELSVDFQPGLNIVTGETGAGKSVIIEAVSMALGSRADTDYIRTGCDKAVVSLVVDTDDCNISDILEDIGAPDDNPLVIRREINAQSKSMCRVNGTPVALSSLGRLCRRIADIHGQYDHQSLLNPDNHMGVLDLYGGKTLSDVRSLTEELYKEYAAASSALASLKKTLADSAREMDFLKFQASEIRAANLKPGEDEELEAQIRLMQNSENLFTALSEAHQELFSDGGALCALGRAVSSLKNVEGFSMDLDQLAARLSDAYYDIEDTNRNLRELKGSVSFSQKELDEAIERQETINGLKRKYGGSIEAVLDFAIKAESSISSIENSDKEMAALESKIKLCREQYDAAAARLTKLRKDAAGCLENNVNKELSELNFKNARFAVNMTDATPSGSGRDSIEFLISANRGEDLKPLAKVASGGELSRIMLALKRIIGDLDGIPTMIFDEIDTGISGATAGVVGEKLESISEKHQIICITHLPQIASKGSSHFKIEKVSDEISTHTTVVPLGPEERVEELARLLSGTTITETARMQARELLGN